MNNGSKAFEKVENIKKSDLSIYDPIEVGDLNLWLTSQELETVLNAKLVGVSLAGLALRTRSKRVKEIVCDALGYKRPKSFKKSQPRFPGQAFDIYTQKSNNLQVWNEDLDPSRRYILIRVDQDSTIVKVKVVAGNDLAPLDTTGKLTQKYQARLNDLDHEYELVNDVDTEYVTKLYGKDILSLSPDLEPTDTPINGQVIPISDLYTKLKNIVGRSFVDPGADQERNRGAELHKLVCKALGYNSYKDNGQFPDIRHQLLEIKLQTSPTIDLGLVSPDSDLKLDLEKINNIAIRHKDVRYAIFYGKIENGIVTITNLILTNGEHFFGRLPKFEGKGLNKKIQIPLPKNFFD
jgi:hypothetical protein